jgi:hypothetical protein
MSWKNTAFTTSLSLIISWAFTTIFIVPFCGALFGCGCTWLWAGAGSNCVGMMDNHSMHHTCPWCIDSPTGWLIPIILILASQTAIIVLLWLKYRAHILALIASGLAAFFAVGFIESLFHGWFNNYPH